MSVRKTCQWAVSLCGHIISISRFPRKTPRPRHRHNTRQQTTFKPPNQKPRKDGGRKAYINLNNLLHARPGSLKNSLDIIAASLGLIGDAALDESAGAVSGDLARDPDLVAGADGLGLGC